MTVMIAAASQLRITSKYDQRKKKSIESNTTQSDQNLKEKYDKF